MEIKIENDKKIQELAKEAIKERNPYTICFLGINFIDELSKEIKNKMVETLIRTKSAKYIYRFASQVKDAPMNRLAVGIVETKDVEYIEMFAQIEGAPVDYLAGSIAKIGTAQDIYRFAMSVSKAPKEKLAKAICKKGSTTDIEAYAYDVMHVPTEVFMKEYKVNDDIEPEIE